MQQEVFQKEKIYKYFSILLILSFFISCNKEQVQLPKSDKTILKDIKDHSPVYMFFRVNEKDTIIKVNRQNTISSTNWVYNIDKRLPLRLVIPEIIKLQEKKKNSSHKKEGAIDVFSYADSIGNNLAFLPFTEMEFELVNNKRKQSVVVNDTLSFVFNEKTYNWASFKSLVKELTADQLTNLELGFDEQTSYNDFIVVLTKLKKETEIDFVKIYVFRK